jgi:hypothetical protein
MCSRHSPIMMKLNIGDLQSKCPKQAESAKIQKPAWYKATQLEKNQYTALLNQRLADVVPPDSLTCSDVNCQLLEHTRERDCHVLDVMCAVMEASHECIPLSSKARPSGKAKRENLPGWKENVAPAKEDALFWHATWISAGRPSSGGLYQVMRWTRNQFHYAVRRAKRLAGTMKARKLLEAAEEGNSGRIMARLFLKL